VLHPSLPQLQTLVVDIGDIAAGYKIPGQFVQIKVSDCTLCGHSCCWHGRLQPSPGLGNIITQPPSLHHHHQTSVSS